MLDRMIYVANSGMERIMLAQTMQLHNLANVNTTGFRADIAQAKADMIRSSSYETRINANSESAGFNHATGSIETTGNDLDIAVTGDGWIGVQNNEGVEAMTRNGNFHVSPAGLLENSAGQLVLGNGGPITIPDHEKIMIAGDGTISMQPKGQGPENLVQLDRIRLTNPELENIKRGKDGLFYRTDEEPLEADANVRVTPGALENSNVSAIETMAQIVELARQYEVQVKLMHLAEENAEQAQRIMQVET